MTAHRGRSRGDTPGWTVGDVLALSRERDLWAARLDATWRAALTLGIQLGRDQGWDQCLDAFSDMIGGRVYPAHPSDVEQRRYFRPCMACIRHWLESGGRIPCGRPGCPACLPGTREVAGDAGPDDLWTPALSAAHDRMTRVVDDGD